MLNFVDRQTIIRADWLNHVNNRVRVDVTHPDYGVVAGEADSWAKMQACINANPGKIIYIPPGYYRLSQKLHITTANTKIEGGGTSTFLDATGAGNDLVHFENLALDGSYLSSCGISKISLLRTTTATTGAGLRHTRCSNLEAYDFFIIDMPEGLRNEGGQLNNLTNFRVFASGTKFNASGVTRSTAIKFAQAPLTVGWQPCYTTNVSHFFVATSEMWQHSILVANGDGLQITNGYTNVATVSELCIAQDRNASYVAPVQFTNMYFDGVFKSPHAFEVVADGYTGNVEGVVFTNCFFGQTADTIVKIRKSCEVEFNGCRFGNAPNWGVDAEAANTKLSFAGNRFLSLGTAGGPTGGLRFAGGTSLIITGTHFDGNTGTAPAIRLDGTIGFVDITGCVFRYTSGDLNNTATITRFVFGDNNSQVNGGTASLLGTKLGNTAVTDGTVLDWYEESTFTPIVLINNDVTGITYTTQLGSFTRIGNRVSFELNITLSSKGSLVGNVRIGGLPYVSSVISPINIFTNTLASGVGSTYLQGQTEVSSSSIRLDKFDTSGVSASLTNTDILDTTTIRLSGTYRV